MPSPDSTALLLLCSRLGLPKDSLLTPLTLREWNPLARLPGLEAGPGALLGLPAGEIQRRLDLPAGQAERLAGLLERSEALFADLERLGGLGVQVLTRLDAGYPPLYRRRLGDSAPAALYYAGEPALLQQPGVGVVGSRNLDAAGQACAEFVGNACGLAGLVLVSGGAKGVDSLSMQAALQARGAAVAILADSLLQAMRPPAVKQALQRGDLCLATPYGPEAGFSVGAAMGRNRLIYCLAEAVIVVAAEAGQGGTWAGAVEALKAGWSPVFVLEHAAMPEGNSQLLQRGALPFPHPFPEPPARLAAWLGEHARPPKPRPEQLGLF